MDKWTRLSADQRENLVAYLDGELEDGLTQQIDKVLVQSEVARHEVEALARTWEMLDLLPKPGAPENFTERTLHTLQVGEIRTRLVDQPWFGYVRKGSIGAVWVAGLALCAILGFTITTQLVPNPQADLLANLPLIKNLDIYLEIHDAGFIKDLQRQAIFNVGDADDGDAPARRLELPKATPHNQQVLKERYKDIAENATESERRRIQHNWTTYQALNPMEQAQMQALHAELEQQPEALHALLNTYAMWLQTLTPGQRQDLRQAATSGERLQKVREFKEKQDAARDTQIFDVNLDLKKLRPMLPPGRVLSDDELAAVMEILLRGVSAGEQPKLRSDPVVERYLNIFRKYGWRGPQQQQILMTDEQLDAIIEAISDEQIKERLKSHPAREGQRIAVMGLTRFSLQLFVWKHIEKDWPTEEQLRSFFATLSPTRREELLKESSDDGGSQKMTFELLRDYAEKKPELKQAMGFVMQMRGFDRPPDGQRGWRPLMGFGPPGERRGDGGPPKDGPPPNGRRPDGPRPQPPPPPPERSAEKPNF